MPSQIYSLARTSWFEKNELQNARVHPEQSPSIITYADMLKFGGPREYSKCDYCTTQEWRSRIEGKNCYVQHECKDSSKHDFMKKRCAVVFTRGWAHLRRNYNFALTIDPQLPGLRCLFVVANSKQLLHHGAHPGFMIWRKRMSVYKTTICAFSDLHKYNLKDYDFIVMTIHGGTPIISQKNAPPLFLYGHDHHKADIKKRAQELFAQQPAALLTPYPSIWANSFNIHKNTKVIFAPYLSDPIWSEMNQTFNNRKLDVLVIGTAGALYPERRVMHDFLKSQKTRLPFSLKLWESPKPMPEAENVGARQYGSPPLALWSQFLSQAKICIFGQDKFGYLVNKYAEVAGACSLMVAPMIPECKSVGLIANQNYVPLQRPIKQALIPQLSGLLKQFDTTGKQIALRGLDWFQQSCSRWLYDNFWQEINTVLEAH